MPDFSLWDNPMYAVKMEKPIILDSASDTGSGTVIACALSSNMRQVLSYHDDEQIEDFAKEMLEFAMPIEAEALEKMGDLSASELTGTLINISTPIIVGKNAVGIDIVVGLVHEDDNCGVVIHYFAVLTKDETDAYLDERKLPGSA